MSFAKFALILWPILCIIFYKKMPLAKALCVSLIGGYLLLPVSMSWDLPLLPRLDKNSIPPIVALALTAIALGNPSRVHSGPPGWLPRNPLVQLMCAMLILGSFGTILTNQDTVFYGPKVLPGLRLYDAFSVILELMVMMIPLVLGRKLLSSPESQRILLVVLTVSAAIYCLPALYEVRMSPRLHVNVYGYFPHSWFQAIRQGGYRPNVFLSHGLELAVFLVYGIIGAIGLFRMSEGASRSKWLFLAVFMFGVLILCKSLGSLVIAILLAPVALLCRMRTQLIVAACVSGIVLLYPAMRAADLVPVDRILATAESIDPERASSFLTRVYNEDILLEKARERPLLGWGPWARARVYDWRGIDISITDGRWVGEFGVGGWVRYLGIFGLLCWPAIALFLSRREVIAPVSVTLALVLAVNLIDLIPNSALIPLIWLMVGSLLGALEMRARVGDEQDEQQVGPQLAKSRSGGSGRRVEPGSEDPQPVSVYRREFPEKGKKKDKAPERKGAAGTSRERPAHSRGTTGLGYRK